MENRRENDRLRYLRDEMKKEGIDVCIIPTSDFHASEYVGDHFKAREFLTGFTGSAGTAVVTACRAGLWTDGRYFLQAERELEGSGFELFRAGEEGVPEVGEFVREKLPDKGKIGFDGRVVSAARAEEFQGMAEEKRGYLCSDTDPVGRIWGGRPPLSREPIWIFPEAYAGESALAKLARIRKKMREAGADYHLVSFLCDIAWILNLRGSDIRNVPVFLSFLLIGSEKATLFVQEEALSGRGNGDFDSLSGQETEIGGAGRHRITEYLHGCGVQTAPYGDIYGALAALPGEATILLDRGKVNYRLTFSLPEGIRVIDGKNPSELMRAVKNETEIKNTRLAHIKDGVAVTKFMYWVKKSVGRRGTDACSRLTHSPVSDGQESDGLRMDEYTVGCRAQEFRAGQEHFLGASFDTVCAYGSNAAVVHYAAREGGAARILPEGMLLVDSGGHYLEGTTDITRTFVLGPVTQKMKLHFTTVVRCNLALAGLRFLHGCTGISMDAVCRASLWEMGLDYRHGTGHGVGHVLNVHEEPNGFRYRVRPESGDAAVFEPGMITTDEPGIYLEGEYGIRIENELLCVEDEENEYGCFLRFEPLTLCPIDLDGIEAELMSEKERRQLNEYHRLVYEKISPYLTADERAWLKEYTREIS